MYDHFILFTLPLPSPKYPFRAKTLLGHSPPGVSLDCTSLLGIFCEGEGEGSESHRRALPSIHKKRLKRRAAQDFPALFVKKTKKSWRVTVSSVNGGWSEHSATVPFLCKTCEQFVYTAWQKYVGRFTQFVWRNKRLRRTSRVIVDNQATYPRFPPGAPTPLSTRRKATSHLLHSHSSTLSTLPTIMTTTYI